MAVGWITILDMVALIFGSIGAGMMLAEPTRVVGVVLIAIASGIKAFQKSLEENNIKNVMSKA